MGKKRKKSRKRLRKQMLNKADKALPPALRYAATKYDHKASFRQRTDQGTFGAASEVRDITGDN